MKRPLVTRIDQDSEKQKNDPILVIFNEHSGPGQVIDLVNVKHAFIEYEVWKHQDEQGRPAWILILTCETATAEEVLDLVGSRLPDYIQVRRFPLSRLSLVRSSGELVTQN